MIQANELRIGNWIMVAGTGELHPVLVNIDNLRQLTTGPEYANPIPLTPEILEKVWGKRKKIKGVSQIRDIDDPEPEGDTEYWDNGKFTIVRWNKGDFILSTSHGFDNRIVLTSLHQLQNLYFALTGQELEYKP